ncbi:guanine nucleotide binding protein, alpha subunit [Mycena olivaceomarginata]|nr:guanine nucleotide binding protein, alpha subunit [Mycena olivaceomarginata]
MRSIDVDPLAEALAPPQNESPEQRHHRRQQAKRQPKPVKILLLGQSESGKSTTLKNFQLMCEPKAFRAERASWRAIVQLNVIRSVRIILDALTASSSAADSPSPRASSSSRDSHSLRLDADLLALRMRLFPLLEVHDTVMRRLASPSDDLPPASPSPSSFRTPALSTIFRRRTGKEVTVNSNVPWKTAFMRDGSERESFATQDAVDWEDPTDPGMVLHERAEDLRRLWAHPTVHAALEHQGIRLQESGGFFLDEIDVVTSQRYVPTDDHILRARLKTLTATSPVNSAYSTSEAIVHCAVSTTRIDEDFNRACLLPRAAKWVPYFDDMNCIIFLAPISAFDQKLEEEPEMSRLADSAAIWTSIIANKLLQNTNIILFLNKIDILEAKLRSGIRFADYVASYGKRPNDFDSASRYMRKQFAAILKDSSPIPRLFYCHLTSAVNMKSTQFVLLGSA